MAGSGLKVRVIRLVKIAWTLRQVLISLLLI